MSISRKLGAVYFFLSNGPVNQWLTPDRAVKNIYSWAGVDGEGRFNDLKMPEN